MGRAEQKWIWLRVGQAIRPFPKAASRPFAGSGRGTQGCTDPGSPAETARQIGESQQHVSNFYQGPIYAHGGSKLFSVSDFGGKLLSAGATGAIFA